tara:strand:- start:34599 stop:36110 length:1512 start_codon:yes stop_codon:yes gene_type:complete
MASTRSNPAVSVRAEIISNFVGVDSSADVTALDRSNAQSLDTCNNAYCDWRGQITRNPAASLVIDETHPITHIRFYTSDDSSTNVVYAIDNGNNVSIKSDAKHLLENAYSAESVVTSTVFNDDVHMTSQTGAVYAYNGLTYTKNSSASIDLLSPKYIASVQRRLCVAGLIGKSTSIQLSRVDSSSVFPDDESPNDENVLRAGEIDIGNLIGTADEIKGISAFEQRSLAIFTRNKCLIYTIDPSIDQWIIDDRANINIGTISHNTIKQAGTDLLFCSQRGVHSIARSRDNGILVFANVLSDSIDITYRSLVKQVKNKESINAVWEPETSQYHVFFPITPNTSKRLTLTLTMAEENPNRWSTGDYLNAVCGDSIGDRTVLGCRGGAYEVFDIEDDNQLLTDNVMTIKTPVLWHGSMTQDKSTHSFFIHASGKGDILVEIFNEKDQLLSAFPLEIEEDSDGSFPNNPINRQYDRKFEARYRGLRVKLTSQGKGLVRVSAIGFNVRK